MKSRLIITIILVVISFVQGFGQARVNRQKLLFNEESGILSRAIGWRYNSEIGEWVDYENVIYYQKNFKEKDKSLQGEIMMSQLKQSFLTIQTKTIQFQEKKYFVLIIKKWAGRIEYSEIQENWSTFKQTIGYIYTEDEYSKIKQLDKTIELKTKYVVAINSIKEEYNETNLLDLIQEKLLKGIDIYTPVYIFPISKSEEGAIRFYLPESFLQYDFKQKYFETDFDSFSKIIIK